MLVDTGSTYIVLSPGIIKGPGLHETPYSAEPTPPIREGLEARLYLAEAKAKGRKGPVLVAGLETPTPLLGVYALETLGLRVDPRTGS